MFHKLFNFFLSSFNVFMSGKYCLYRYKGTSVGEFCVWEAYDVKMSFATIQNAGDNAYTWCLN